MGVVSAPQATFPASSNLSQKLQLGIISTFHLLLLTVPFFFTWVNEELFEFNKIILLYVLTVIIAGLWCGRMILEKKWLIRRTPFDLVILLFVISQIVSTLFSIHPRTSFFGYYTRFNGGLLSTLSYVTLFYAFVSQVSKKQLQGVITAALLAGVGVALYAIPEHFGASPSCFLISEGARFNTACWVQDVQNRVFGTFGQPNWLAAYAVTLIPLGIVSFVLSFSGGFTTEPLPAKKPRSSHFNLLPFTLTQKMLLSLISVGALWCTLLFTKSRSGMLGATISLIVLTSAGVTILLSLFFKKKLPNKKNTLLLASCTGVILAVILGLSLVFGTPFSSFLPKIFSPAPSSTAQQQSAASSPIQANRLEAGGTDSGEIRMIVWQGAVNVGLRYPLFGSGVETFGYSYYQDRPAAHNLVSEWDFLYNKAHNEFLNYWATTGAFGLLTYCALLGWFLIWTTQQLVTRKDLPTLLGLAGLGAGIIGLTFTNIFGFSTVMVTILFWLYLGAAVVMTESSRTWPLVLPFKLPPFTPFMLKAALTGVLLVSIWGISIISNWWLADYDFALGKRLLENGQTAEGLDHLQTASRRMPQEALFMDELSITYAQLALAYQQQNETDVVPELTAAAVAASDQTLTLNPRHLNFYKNRARVFIILAEIDPQHLLTAQKALETASLLAPTDAKLLYNLALVEAAEGNLTAAQTHLEKTVSLKADYEAAHLELAALYLSQNNATAAAQSYRFVLENIAADNPTALAGLQAAEASQAAQLREKP